MCPLQVAVAAATAAVPSPSRRAYPSTPAVEATRAWGRPRRRPV